MASEFEDALETAMDGAFERAGATHTYVPNGGAPVSRQIIVEPAAETVESTDNREERRRMVMVTIRRNTDTGTTAIAIDKDSFQIDGTTYVATAVLNKTASHFIVECKETTGTGYGMVRAR